MSWEDILKRVSERERLDAEDFASDEMGQWRDDKRKKDEEGVRNAIPYLLSRYIESEEHKRDSALIDSMKQLLRLVKNAPRLSSTMAATRDKDRNIEYIQAWLDLE